MLVRDSIRILSNFFSVIYLVQFHLIHKFFIGVAMRTSQSFESLLTSVLCSDSNTHTHISLHPMPLEQPLTPSHQSASAASNLHNHPRHQLPFPSLLIKRLSFKKKRWYQEEVVPVSNLFFLDDVYKDQSRQTPETLEDPDAALAGWLAPGTGRAAVRAHTSGHVGDLPRLCGCPPVPKVSRVGAFRGREGW